MIWCLLLWGTPGISRLMIKTFGGAREEGE